MIKKVWSAHFWPVGSHAFGQNGPPHGALTKWDGNFFHKRYPLWILILYRKMFSNVKIGPVWAGWHIFSENRPPLNSDFVWRKVEKFSNRPILGWSADPPLFKTARKMGPQIHELAIFYIKRTPFEFGFCVGKSSKILKLDNSGPIGRPLNISKTAHNMGPQIHELAIFFIKQTPFQFWFCSIYDWKIFKLVHFGPIGRPPISPNNELAIFFIRIDLP